jgi:hypothetical protein
VDQKKKIDLNGLEGYVESNANMSLKASGKEF